MFCTQDGTIVLPRVHTTTLELEGGNNVYYRLYVAMEPLLKDNSEMRTPWLIRTLGQVPTFYKYILFYKDTSLLFWSQGCPYWRSSTVFTHL